MKKEETTKGGATPSEHTPSQLSQMLDQLEIASHSTSFAAKFDTAPTFKEALEVMKTAKPHFFR